MLVNPGKPEDHSYSVRRPALSIGMQRGRTRVALGAGQPALMMTSVRGSPHWFTECGGSPHWRNDKNAGQPHWQIG